MGLGLYDVGSPAEKALQAQAGALGTMAQQTKEQSTITTTKQGSGSTMAKGISGVAQGAVAGAGFGLPGIIVGGVLGGLLSLFD